MPRRGRRPRGWRRSSIRLMVMGLLLLAAVFYLVVSYLLPKPPPEGGPSTGGTSCKGSAQCIKGEVTKIVDGDTLYIGDLKIRLALVNTPEVGEAGYDGAKNFTASLCPVGTQATADQDDKQLKDQYNRTIAVVYCGGKNLNEELLKSGHAVMLTQLCDESEFESESWAREYGC